LDDDKNVFEPSAYNPYNRGGQLICLNGNLDKATLSGGSYLLMEIETSLGSI